MLEWAYEKCPATKANRPGPAEPLSRDGRSDMDEPTCVVSGCDRPVRNKTHGWCDVHYQRWLAKGDVGEGIPIRRANRDPDGLCSVDGCDRPVRAWGWCKPHYKRWKKTGDVGADAPVRYRSVRIPGEVCTVEGCGKARKSREWCNMHYKRWLTYGDPLKVAWIKGDDRARFESHVDRSGGPDACHLWTGSHDQEGYGITRINGATIRSHLLAWEFENGPRPAGSEMDHECHNQAIRDGLCKPGKCPHRLCCNLRHLIQRADRQEHHDATPSMAMRRLVGNRKLTPEQAREIFVLMQDPNARPAEVADRYGINVSQVRRIRRGAAWGWLNGQSGIDESDAA